jgi:hypothetical protein
LSLAYVAERRMSVGRRMAEAARQPRHLEEYVRWWRREWDAECPPRIHERGTEPESALGSPRLAGAFRAYLMGTPFATDHDDRLDSTTADAARRFPVHATLAIMDRRWPLSARFLFELGFLGAEWQDITLAWRMLPEVGHRFAHGTLQHAWVIWTRDAMGVA